MEESPLTAAVVFIAAVAILLAVAVVWVMATGGVPTAP